MLTKCLSIHNKAPVTKWSVCVLLMGISALIFSRPVDAHLAPIASIAGQSFGEVISDDHSLGRSDPEDAIPAIELGKRRHASAKEEGHSGSKDELHQALGSAEPTAAFVWAGQHVPAFAAQGKEGFMLQPGQQAPSFQLEGINGDSYSLTNKPVKPVLINFWASWCDPCRLEAPILNRLYDQYHSRLEIFGVNVTKYDHQKDAKQFVASLGLKYPILMDQKGEVFSTYKGMAFPMSILVGTDGRIKEVMLGMFHEEELEARILKVLDAEKQLVP